MSMLAHMPDLMVPQRLHIMTLPGGWLGPALLIIIPLGVAAYVKFRDRGR